MMWLIQPILKVRIENATKSNEYLVKAEDIADFKEIP
jgi:hypothetical protein